MNSKINLKPLLFMVLMALAFNSCRSESDELIEAPDDQSLKADSKVANLILRTSSKNVSYDDSIDDSSCFSIKFPYTITANGQEITFTSLEDVTSVDDIFDDTDEIIFNFPITIVFNDFSETVIDNTEQFNEVKENCQDETGNEHIECIDFKFPFSASVFNSQSELITTVLFEKDKDLYRFVTNLSEADIANVNFPITIVLSEGTEINVSNLDDLQSAIDDVIEKDCNDDDDDDDDNGEDDGDEDGMNDMSIESFSETLTSQTWEVLKYKNNESNETKTYKDFIFDFSDDKSVLITNEETQEIINGTWSVSNTMIEELIISFDFGTTPPLAELNNDWNVKKFEEDQIKLDQTESDGISKDQLFFMSK